MMKTLFYLIIRIRLHILWYSKMHCSRGERWHNGQGSDVTVSSGWKQVLGDVNEAAKTAAKKINSKIRRANGKIISVSKILQDWFVHTHKEPGTWNKAGAACGCRVLWLAHFLIKDTSSRQSSLTHGLQRSRWYQDNILVHFHADAMIGLKERSIQTWWPYLLVRRQCDIQIADGGLRNALGGFWLFQKGEAPAGLLTHISDLKTTEGKTMRTFCKVRSTNMTNIQKKTSQVLFGSSWTSSVPAGCKDSIWILSSRWSLTTNVLTSFLPRWRTLRPVFSLRLLVIEFLFISYLLDTFSDPPQLWASLDRK